MKNFLRRLNYRMRHDFLTVENVVLVLAIGLCLMWTYQSIVAMSRNWELSEKLTTEKKNLELIQLEVEAAELENVYYGTDEYKELMARQNLDKKLDGENMVVMPQNSESAKNKHEKQNDIKVEVVEYSNFEKWTKFLFPDF